MARLDRFRSLLNRPAIDRAFTVCTPFRGANALHAYEPPFGLNVYDDRYSGTIRYRDTAP